MNRKQRALVREQRAAGQENGEAIARIVIAGFPGGFSSETGGEICKITDKALAHVLDRFAAAGVDEEYRTPFATGFKTGLRNTYSAYSAAALGALALGIKQSG